MCRGSSVVIAGKELTTINLLAASSELAVGVHLVTHSVLQHDHIFGSALRSDLGRGRLEVATAPDLSRRSLRRAQMGCDRDLRQKRGVFSDLLDVILRHAAIYANTTY